MADNESVQKQVFTQWCNYHLKEKNLFVNDLFKDFSDGKLLIQLLKTLSNKFICEPNNGFLRSHYVANITRCLEFLKHRSLKLRYLSAENIVDGNPAVILTLFENIILSFNVDNIEFNGKTGKPALLAWCQEKTKLCSNVSINNFTTSWRSGLAFNALIHAHHTSLVDYNSLKVNEHIKNINSALNLAYINFDMPKLIMAKEVDVEIPDEAVIITYVSQLYQHFEKHIAAKNVASSKISGSGQSGKQHSTKTEEEKTQERLIKELQEKLLHGNWLKNTNKTPTYSIPKKYETYNSDINAVGIDLGTSSCCIAVNRKYAIEVVAIDNKGERILPSYIGFDEKNPKCGKIVVDRLGTYARSTVFDTKRLIGKRFDTIQKDTSWTFKIRENGESLKIEFEAHDGTIIQKSPEEMAAILLSHMKQKVQEFQGRDISSVVITIPASFTESQKEATLTAGKLAGWKDITLLPEPVAASFAYFIDRSLPENETILLFDLGGGTLDICIFKIVNGTMQIISNTGDPSIGGRDFDKLLFDYFKQELMSKYNIDIDSRKKKYRLLSECQNIKHSLTVRHDERLDVEDFDNNQEGLITLTRNEFEVLSSKLTEKMKELIESALREAKYQPYQINKVFRVGGSSRMPIIDIMLKKIFPQAEHCVEQNPDEVVALGAAYYAYHLANEKQ